MANETVKTGDGTGTPVMPPNGGGAPNGQATVPARRPKPAIIVVFLIVLVAAAFYGYHYWSYSQSHVSTDDAFITGNLVAISPVVAGTLTELKVDEGDHVTKGQLIARLDDSSEQAALNQALAAYHAAQSMIPQAEADLAFQRAATTAAVDKAHAGIAAQMAKTQGSAAQADLTSLTITDQERQARSQLETAAAQAEQAFAQVGSAAANVQVLKQSVETAKQAAAAAASNVAAAVAAEERASADEHRYTGLLAQDAVTRQQYDTVLATERSAKAQLAAVRSQAEQARSQVAQAGLAVRQAEAQLQAARRQAAAVHDQIGAARAVLALAQANRRQVPIQQANVSNNRAGVGQAEADLENAKAGGHQVILREKQVRTADFQAKQQLAAVENARTAEADTYIHAPSDGRVVKKSVNVGTALTPGESIVTVTEGEAIWITANFKETQLSGVRPGQHAEITVDAFPGKTFQGQVQSINEATGASLALLPPDNATGNFTKVVQRVPVRIALVPAANGNADHFATAEDIKGLRQGMSVTATIDTASGASHK